jgi:thiol-disulfide isomerase/thioredoxin
MGILALMNVSGNAVPPTRCGYLWTWVLLSLFLTACGGQRARKTRPIPNAGPVATSQTPVDFNLAQLDGERLHLTSYRGQVVMVIYFTTWCAPCAELLPQLNGLMYGKDALKNMVAIGVNVDLQPKKLLPAFIDSWGLKLPIVLGDSAALHGRTPFGRLPAVPTIYIVDREGHHVETLVGTIPTAYLRRRAETLGAIR